MTPRPRKPQTEENEWFSFRIDADVKRELRTCAVELECSMAEVVKDCLDVYLQAARAARESTD